jgi:hypothetical protein
MPERQHYKTIVDPRVKIVPESNESFDLFVSKGIETVATITMELTTTWSKYSFLNRFKHRVTVNVRYA